MDSSEVKGIIKSLVQKSVLTFRRDKDFDIEFLPPPREGLSKAGFRAPTYSKSRQVRIDPDLLSRNRCVSAMPDAPETESYRVLRTQVLHRAAQKGGNTVMITSAVPGEGKTLSAINLALIFSREFNQTVLLVDCDLRKQSVHNYLGIENGLGLSDYLLDDVPIEDIIVWPGIDKLTLISGSRTILESAELLGSPKMRALVTEMKGRYADRFVLFDVPPVLASADAFSFAPMVDHIILVALANSTSMRDVKRALSLLPRDKVMGVVLNKYQLPRKPYYYKRYPEE